ncbi:MAG: glutamine--fructose-6-phosphate transaminase (isomerizing) [candidate division Zixibacteria bacterium]|nr:glutamine--fructose-6-phosphate transaminase (isomerizing) [candidate division Zixibacteria bacterium]
MCGIVGYVGDKKVVPILLDGLKRLEYRGYDSAGIAVLEEEGILSEKCAGKVSALEKLLGGKSFQSTTGIAHTRWATHGEPTDLNAHPHLDCKKQIAVVHNGIIENYRSLKELLSSKGHIFTSDTDTEILAHLIEEYYGGDLVEAVRTALSQVEGTYGIAVICKENPEEIVAARHGSPLVIGRGQGENLVASDCSAIIRHTNQVVYLEDREIARITKNEFSISTINKVEVTPHVQEVSWSLDQIEKGGYSHFMLKEINEQPITLQNAMRGRLNYEEGTSRLNGLNLQYEELHNINRIILSACGTSWHAALIGEYLIEDFASIPVEVEYASEFRYRSPIIQDGTVVFLISQSGETADTLAALREAKRKGATVLGICNVVGSTIARETDGGVYIHAGPEIGVASTKAFTSQITVLTLLALLLGRMRNLSLEKGREIIDSLKKIHQQVEFLLQNDNYIKEIAKEYYKKNNFLYLGRGINYPLALEGALKLKEISYIHAEGYPAAEMKHGPIALIDENMPAVVIAIKDNVYDKVLSNIEEIKARNGKVIAIATEGDREIAGRVDHVIYIPSTSEQLTPLLTIIPLQLLAYHMAVLRGCHIDQPRNLAKSVTVE